MTQQANTPPVEPPKSLKVKLEEPLINSSIHYMRIKSKAWSNPTKAFTHLITVFMENKWYSGNQIASEANKFFKEAPFTAEEVKRYCEEFAANAIFYRKDKAGKVKYKLTEMGYSMLVEDKVLTTLFQMFEVKQNDDKAKQARPSQPNNEQAPPSATLIANYGTDLTQTDKPSESSPESANQDTSKA